MDIEWWGNKVVDEKERKEREREARDQVSSAFDYRCILALMTPTNSSPTHQSKATILHYSYFVHLTHSTCPSLYWLMLVK
jgi:hypothetical protein